MNWKLWLICLMPMSLMAQDAGPTSLTLEKIMRDITWIGEIPSSVKLAPDGRTAYFSVNREVPLPNQQKMVNLKTGEVVDVDAAHRPASKTFQSWYKGDIRIDDVGSDLWISRGGKPATPLIVRGSSVSFVRFLGEDAIVFREGNQLYRQDLRDGSTIRLTNVSYTDEKKEGENPGWLIAQERELLQHVEARYRLDDFRKENEADNRTMGSLVKPKKAYLGKGVTRGSLWSFRDNQMIMDITEDLKYVALVVEPKKDTDDSTDYANFINKKGSMKALDARGRVSHKTKTWKIALIQPDNGEVTWLDFSDLPEIKTDRLAEIKESLSEEDKKRLPTKRDEDKPRPVMVTSGGFHGNQLLVTVFSRDYKDRWIVLVDVPSMEQTVLYHHYDPAWVQYSLRNLDVPHGQSGSAHWSEDGTEIVFLSDKDGNQHLHTYDVAKKKIRQITKGDYQAFNPFLGPKKKYWYVHANKEHPGEIHFYRVPRKGGKMERLTNGEGRHLVRMSTDGKTLLDTFSEVNRPPRLLVQVDGGKWEERYDGRSEEFKSIPWMKPEVISYKNRDGKPVYARIYKPTKSNGAGVIFTHGAGYLQNAHKGWSTYRYEYMFHNLLAQQGYTVLDPDYQGSAGYGRDWRTAIYRHMGGKDLNDVVDGATFLTKEHGIDAKRLGTYGGSYGGFLTFMAMFTSPDTFQAGAALRPVSDWSHYNHWYAGRILNTPEVDPEAYRRSSPIYHAEGLKGHLLMCHGMMDSNVQYIDVIRLSQKLIELGKKDWELASYPVEAHGFKEGTSWYDEYRRIKELFDENLQTQH